MAAKEKKAIHQYMRLLHRDVGFIVVGVTIIFSLSGMVLIFRDSDFLKQEKVIEKKLSPDLEISALGKELHLKDVKVVHEYGNVIEFQNGTYNKETGVVSYTSKELPAFLNKLTHLHKTASESLIHWFTLLYSTLLFFLAVSSFWMFKPKSKMFKRGIIFVSIGVVIVITLIIAQ